MKYLHLLLMCIFSFNSYAVCDGTVQKTVIPDPVNTGDFEIEARVYRPLANEFPVVFVLPPIVGETPLDGALGLSLCLNGIGAYILDVLNDPPREEEITNLNVHEDGLIRAEIALRTIMSQLKLDPQVKQNFGIMGASQGGIISAYLAGVIPELKATVLLASGGNVGEILAESEQESIKSLREDRIRAFNLSGKEEYQNLVTPYVTLDPLNVSDFVAPSSTLLFIMTNDTDVPTSNQRLLAEAIKEPEVVEINNTHVPGIIEASTRYADRIIQFFKSRL